MPESYNAKDKRRLENEQIVCLYCEDWYTSLRTSKHQLMSHFAKNNRVLYVEIPLHFLVFFKRPREFLKGLRKCFSGIRHVQDNLYTYSPFGILPYHSISKLTSSLFINRLNQYWISFFFRRALKKLGFDNPIFWFYLPHAVEIVDKFNPKLIVFHVIDEWSGFSGIPHTFLLLERNLLSKSNLVIVTAQYLFDSKSKFCKEIHLVRHGADLDLFRRAQLPETEIPSDIKKLCHPIIGYYGALHKIDLELVKFAAESRPHWSFVFIGPTGGAQGGDVSMLSQLTNVHFLGSRPQQVLPNYLKGIDVAIMPFKINRLNLNMCPIKMYEFLAAGKPVVSVALPEVRVLNNVIAIAADKNDFVSKIEEVLEGNNQKLIEQRQEAVAKYSWQNRIKQIENLVCQKLDSLNKCK